MVFAAQLFFNYLIGAPDAHAKNYSVLLGLSDGPTLAPLYDVASGLPYGDDREKRKMAMSIGGENRIGRLRRSNLQRFAEAASLQEKMMVDLMANLADAVIANLPILAEEAASIPSATELTDRLFPKIRSLCENTLATMEV